MSHLKGNAPPLIAKKPVMIAVGIIVIGILVGIGILVFPSLRPADKTDVPKSCGRVTGFKPVGPARLFTLNVKEITVAVPSADSSGELLSYEVVTNKRCKLITADPLTRNWIPVIVEANVPLYVYGRPEFRGHVTFEGLEEGTVVRVQRIELERAT